MRLKSSTLRVLSAALGIGLLWLASSAPVSAAVPGPAPSNDSSAASSQPIARTLRKLVYQSRLVRGPAAKRFRLALFDLKHRTQKVGHAAHAGIRDDDQAIQNDTAATEIAIVPFAELQPIGFFVETVHQATFVVAFSPRSPRGPPTDV